MEKVVTYVYKGRSELTFLVTCGGEANGVAWGDFGTLPDVLKEPISLLLMAFSDKLFEVERIRDDLPDVGTVFSLANDRAGLVAEYIKYDRKTKTFVDTREQ